ncbi:MAG: NTP transferase domain-containing protein, partial [Firmicutes bacterium]|nr:NTP transferase domain-containing protein [Bacillota bacterium]
VVNPRPEAGLASSLRLGVQEVAAARPEAAVVVFLVDQPFIREADVAAVLAAYRRRPPGVHWVRPVYDGMPGHPVVIAPDGRGLVEELGGDQGLGPALRNRPGVLTVVRPVTGPCHPSWDIDTEADYRRALACLEKSGL